MKKSKCYFNRLIDLKNEAISKVKESYDKKIKDLKERLFGHKKIFHKGNKIVCEYGY